MTDFFASSIEVEAVREPDTKNKRKYLFRSLGISGGIYIDKAVPEDKQPEVITVTLKE